MTPRPRLGAMVGAGGRAVGRYTGTLLAVFVVQTIVMVACMFAMATVLANVFATNPMWDDAVDGDIVSLVYCVRFARVNLVACSGIAFAGILLWQLASWFLAGGVYAVLAQRPEGRRDTARCFGAGGTATYLAYVRVALCSLPGWLVVMFVFGACSAAAASRFVHALSVADLIAPLALSLVPALALAHVLGTIADYARVELAVRLESHDPSAIGTYVRTIGYVLRQPITLVHGALGWLGFALVTVVYAYIAHGHPMYGAEGAIALFVIRQGVALARAAIRFGVLAGHVELGRTRALPPRRADADADAVKS